jgi:hypothetical protein
MSAAPEQYQQAETKTAPSRAVFFEQIITAEAQRKPVSENINRLHHSS